MDWHQRRPYHAWKFWQKYNGDRVQRHAPLWVCNFCNCYPMCYNMTMYSDCHIRKLFAWCCLGHAHSNSARAFTDSVHSSLQCLYPSRVDIRKRVVQNLCCKRKGIHVAIALLRKETNSANIFPKVHALLCWVAILLELSSKTLKFISPVIKLVFNVLNFHRLDTKLRWFCFFQ